MPGPQYLFSQQVIDRVRREFGSDADRVIEELDRLPSTRDRDRLPIAVLELAKRDVPSVIGLVEQALIDSSEVLSWVENS
ncbi:MAG: hypothetical protein QMC04_02795 [Ilumatobacter sp.]|jgi:hypothetical protein|uniref:hypothetical protein n=1 Tax=uncultured Ilumatobacter sp. TaxID=879968 RepID=UPI003591E930|tara:strand:+ start:53 stop:292 length:240 start_codon:yes stop_codon:yes gene_type:complete